jgi:hypothetical protein
MTAGKGGAGRTGPGKPGGTRSPEPGRRRPGLIAAAVAAAVAVLLVVLLAVLGNDEGDAESAGASRATTPAAGASTETGVPTPPPTPVPTGPTGVVDEPPPALPEVALDAAAAVGNGIVARLPTIEAIEGSGVGPGNIAGPALRVTVRIENGTADAVSLDGVAVNFSYGADHTPASPLDDPSGRPFGGMLAAGEAADGIYVFSVPADARDSVTVEVGYQAGAPLLLFTGRVA